ncbi:MAG TPA: histidine phosphatase family protein [Acidimicrobiales bacterium]|nr:histidine phosphatase family protein [Acidimicrobiales bacterium]
MISSPQRPLVLVRHAESSWNELRLIQGQNDEARLTDRGRQQAAAVAQELQSREFDLVVSSDLRRATETAAIIAEVLGLAVETDRLLRERGFGVAEGGPVDQLIAQTVGVIDGVVTDDSVSPEGGETLRDFRERAGRFIELRELKWPDQRLLVITHGGTIRALQSYSEGTSFLGSRWDRVANCSVWTVTPRSGWRRSEHEG